MTHCDLLVTWPKKRPFGSYVAEIANASRLGLKINYRVFNPPALDDRYLSQGDCRLYRVHDGIVRGWTPIIEVTWRGANEVARVESDSLAGFWPEGFYIVCDPIFRDCLPVPVPGFRGWRWFDRTTVRE